MFVVTVLAQSNAVVCVRKVFRVFTKTAPVMYFCAYVVALLTVMHALAKGIELQEPFAEFQPSNRFVELSQFIICTVAVIVATVFVTPAVLGQHWTTNVTTSLERAGCHFAFLFSGILNLFPCALYQAFARSKAQRRCS